MFKRLKKTFARKTKVIKLNTLTKTLPGLALACTITLIPAFGQEIMIDGKTNTILNTHGITTDISTSTIKGSNAYNSFVKFNINTGKVVNLNVPDNCTGLINLVHDEASQINGILNSLKSGMISGNVFLANPHGIVVGNQGVINVGSLTAITPTTDFMNNFFDAPFNPNDASVDALLNGTTPINYNATIDHHGKINSITNIQLETGSFTTTGEIYTNALFGPAPVLGDIVNLNTLDYLATIENLVLENGNITIKSSSYTQLANAKIISGNDVSILSDNGLQFSQSSIYANNKLTLNIGDYSNNDFAFVPAVGSVKAGMIESDFLPTAPNQPLEIISSKNVEIGNLDYIFINNKPLAPSSINLQGYDVSLSGKNTIGGNIRLQGENNTFIGASSNIYSGGNLVLSGKEDTYIQSFAMITAVGNVTVNSDQSDSIIHGYVKIYSDGNINILANETTHKVNILSVCDFISNGDINLINPQGLVELKGNKINLNIKNMEIFFLCTKKT